MNYLKNQVLTEKTIRLLQQNQYTFDVVLQSNKTEIKAWIEQFFNVKVETINSHRLPIKKRGSRTLKHLVYGKRMIIKLKRNYSIPLFLNE
uniref:Large ribosomal subunit protein uL23c n=1 Tax=Trichomanes trollii TaxID=1481379 RepID=A0A410YET7_9MONI|nr:ribosomal protein L23 [Trichomanes trollii]QAV57701.1 ribosomal protein L23 [Trichomanes trollii]